MGDSNMQYVTSTSFLLLAYAKYLTTAHKFVDCGGITVTPNRLRALAKRQVQPMRITFLFHLTIMMSPKQFYSNYTVGLGVLDTLKTLLGPNINLNCM